ncbi:hypothetical protein [Streptomyces sp. RP5T]|uniref:hypothetical protein n=1 Tax=Streptomyces sp. RP5T TaxID=2490848 RepID=UPI000F652900|nr:hypothetical protein [Streptomyces sp. RP5T]RRR74372.1 hypothetical protein EHS43_35570 [Streptomyces sp. RP5T]
MAGSVDARVRVRRSRTAAVWAVLLTVVLALPGSSVLSGERFLAGGGPVLAAVAQHGEPHQNSGASGDGADSGHRADGVDPGVGAVVVRSHGDAAAERHAPFASVQDSPPAARTGLGPEQPPLATGGPPVSDLPAHRHGIRAPPEASGI